MTIQLRCVLVSVVLILAPSCMPMPLSLRECLVAAGEPVRVRCPLDCVPRLLLHVLSPSRCSRFNLRSQCRKRFSPKTRRESRLRENAPGTAVLRPAEPIRIGGPLDCVSRLLLHVCAPLFLFPRTVSQARLAKNSPELAMISRQIRIRYGERAFQIQKSGLARSSRQRGKSALPDKSTRFSSVWPGQEKTARAAAAVNSR